MTDLNRDFNPTDPVWVEVGRTDMPVDKHGRRRVSVHYVRYEPFDPPVTEIAEGGIWSNLRTGRRVVVRIVGVMLVTFQEYVPRYGHEPKATGPTHTLTRRDFLQDHQRVYR